MSDLIYRNRMELINSHDDIIGELNEYRKSGKVDEVKEAAEKQNAKKIITETGVEFIHYKCPLCRVILHQKMTGDKTPFKDFRYCYECGQKLDWS